MPVIKRKRDQWRKLLGTKNQEALAWLGDKGHTGTLSDALLKYFQTTSGLATGTIYDHIKATMDSLGYTGTLGDQLRAYYVAQTGIAYAPDAARQFWKDFSLNFSGVAGDFIISEDGTYILNEDGTKITLE